MARSWGPQPNQKPFERPQRPFRTPVQYNGPYKVAVEPQASPAPIRYGVQNKARPAKRRRYRATWRQELRSIRRSVLLGNKITLVKHMDAPRGRQKPLKQRANIERRAPRSYGNRYINKPRLQSSEDLLAQMGM